MSIPVPLNSTYNRRDREWLKICAPHLDGALLSEPGHAPGRGEHLSLQHCAARLLAFGSPQRNSAGAFLDQCQTLTIQGLAEPVGLVKEVIPDVKFLVPTVEGILDTMARHPESADQMETAGIYVEFTDIPRPVGLTAVLRTTSGGSETMWTYRQPQGEYQPANAKEVAIGAVIKSTRITTAVFKAYAALWAGTLCSGFFTNRL